MSLFLLIDVGNTRLKWAAVESNKHPSNQQTKLWAYSGSISSKYLQSPEYRQELSDYIVKTLTKPDAIIFSCVAGQESINNLQSLFPQWAGIEWKQLKGYSSHEGIRTLYQEPDKLGADRWAAIIAARALSKTNTLIISAGTATTIDLLGSNGVHYGGWILPGLYLMHTILEANTAQLPIATRNEPLAGFGLSTNNAIVSGCDAAQVGAIQYALDIAKEMNRVVETIWLYGGNAKILANILGQINKLNHHKIDVSESLVLRGLWAWHLKNA